MPKQSFGGYVKAAFKIPWNLLAVAAGAAFAFLTGHPDIALPVVAAGELAYLVTTAGHPRFQNYIDNYQGKVDGGVEDELATKRFQELYGGLSPEAQATWDGLRARCESLGELARREGSKIDAIAEEQLAGVDKLLWVHLKLLHTRARLTRFFASTDEAEIERSFKSARNTLAALPVVAPGVTPDPIQDKKRKSLEDTIATLETRKANLKRAHDNFEFVGLELTRIAAKLSGVVELAANRQDPGALTSEVDDAARSVQSTEQMIGELQMFTGLTQEDVEAPKILSAGQKAMIAGRVRAGG